MSTDPSPHPVRAVVAGDRRSRYHVLAPADRLLDLEGLGRFLGKTLGVVAAEPLEAVSAIPGQYPHPVIVDRALLAHDVLGLPDGSGDRVVTSALEFRRLATAATQADCSTPLLAPPSVADRKADLDAVHGSISRFTALRIRERLDATLSIPPLPEAARRILALHADPDFELGELVRIVEADPSLAARLLGWANSAFYSLREPVRSIGDAITRVLGADVVMNMALAITLGQTLRVPRAHVRGLSPYWLGAMYCAATCEALARQLSRRDATRVEPGLAYLTGLLANFGTLVIGHVFPPFYARICNLQEANRHLSRVYVDLHTLGVAREVFAACLLEAWGLPAAVVGAVRGQHTQPDANESAYLALLRLAHRLLAERGLADDPPPSGHGAPSGIDLPPESIEDVMARIARSADDLDGLARAVSA